MQPLYVQVAPGSLIKKRQGPFIPSRVIQTCEQACVTRIALTYTYCLNTSLTLRAGAELIHLYHSHNHSRPLYLTCTLRLVQDLAERAGAEASKERREKEAAQAQLKTAR